MVIQSHTGLVLRKIIRVKILFITYYWPPCGGVSGQRITHFVTELCNLGHECHVIIPDNPSYYSIDDSLLAAIHKEVVEHRVPIHDVTTLLKYLGKANNSGNVKSQDPKWTSRLLKWIRANIFIPDPKVLWLRPVLQKAIKLIKKESFDLVYTNGTPHSLHLVGLRLKEKYGVKWVADFRDPWTGIDFFEHLPLSNRALKKHRELEKKVISHADRIITVSPSWAKEMEVIGNREVQCVTNGYDVINQRQESGSFVIAHIGSLHADRDIQIVIEAISSMSIKSEMIVQLVGSVDSSWAKKLQDIDSNVKIEVIGEVPHYKAKLYMASASVLLLPINKSRDAFGRIPAKLFEYLTTGIPIIALSNCYGDASEIIDKANGGKTFTYESVDEISEYISDIYNGSSSVITDFEYVNQFSRDILAKQLESILLTLVDEREA